MNCPACTEEWRGQYKTCTICGIEYNEKGDMRPQDDAQMERVNKYEYEKEIESRRR